MKVLAAVVPGLLREVSWVMTEPGTYVAHRADRVLGAVVTTDSGSYVALDVDSEGIGRYSTLDEAKRSVDRRGRGAAIPHRFRRVFIFATIAGVIAILATLAAMLLPVLTGSGL